MIKILLKWALSAAVLLAIAHFYSGVQVSNFTSALIAAFAIGLLNTVVRPLLVVLTLPVTILTLGLFFFVINALMFWAAGAVLEGFEVKGFMAALVGSLLYSVAGIVIDSAVQAMTKKT